MKLNQTVEQKAASKAFSDTLRGQAKVNTLSIPFTRESAPHKHPKTGQFISHRDMNDFLRRPMLAQSRPGLNPENAPDLDAQMGGDGGTD